MNLTGAMSHVRRVPWFESCEFSSPFGANHPSHTHRPIDTSGSIMFVASVSRKSNMLRPEIVTPESTPCDSEQTELSSSSGVITTSTAFVRDILNLSRMNATDTSAIEIVEVRAATVRS